MLGLKAGAGVLMAAAVVAVPYHLIKVKSAYNRGVTDQEDAYALRQAQIRDELRAEEQAQAQSEIELANKQVRAEKQSRMLMQAALDEAFEVARAEKQAYEAAAEMAHAEKQAIETVSRARLNQLNEVEGELHETKRALDKKPKTIFKTRIKTVEVPVENENITCDIPTGDVDAINPVWLRIAPELNELRQQTGLNTPGVLPNGR